MPDRVYILVTSPDARGGVARATGKLASQLSESHQVEIIALHRREEGHYDLDPRIKVRCVIDEATPDEEKFARRRTKTPGADRTGSYTALVDRVLPRVLSELPPSIVISTRAILHLELAKHAPAHCITIAQDHTSLRFRENKSNLQRESGDEVTDVDLVGQAIGRLDAYVVLTEADADAYRETFPEAADRLHVIRNPAPWPVLKPEEAPKERKKIIVAVGRLAGRKAFHRLIQAYTPIAKERPDWQVHIYGEGPLVRRLKRSIAEGEVEDYVFLKGHTDQMERVLEEASIMALTSKYEGLPMVLIEAMTKGVPVVSVDCPNGPTEIVVDGVTGTIVENGDWPGFTGALLDLIDEPETRARMSEQALVYAKQYEVDRITQNWLDLFAELEAAKVPTA